MDCSDGHGAGTVRRACDDDDVDLLEAAANDDGSEAAEEAAAERFNAYVHNRSKQLAGLITPQREQYIQARALLTEAENVMNETDMAYDKVLRQHPNHPVLDAVVEPLYICRTRVMSKVSCATQIANIALNSTGIHNEPFFDRIAIDCVEYLMQYLPPLLQDLRCLFNDLNAAVNDLGPAAQAAELN